MTEENLRERAAAMHEAELVLWLYTFERMARLEGRLEMIGGPGPADPFGNMSSAAVGDLIRSELQTRTVAKGGRQE